MKSAQKPALGGKEELSEMIVNVLRSTMASEPENRIAELAGSIQRQARISKPERRKEQQLA